ncbi:ABC transporter permease subunit [Weissella coleopterorum]|uniref:ABC transporter permease subunit n=1 Tax=Weissella coleopterorum TaxID=2714949 RepID=A0A6G8AZD6_9LACO|nr:ABC transporter permease [Weissella coleopterorum]QIL50322.1 ABC transporter permease subunit [Weissella coleopterorum]
MTNYSKLKSEFRKFVRQSLGKWGFVMLVSLMIYFAITTNNIKMAFQSGFGSTQWVTIIMMMVAGNFMDMEYANGTILNLFYKQDHKLTIYINKLFVVSVYGILLVLFSLILTLMVGYLFGDSFSINQVNELLINFFGTLIYSFFMIALSFLLLPIFKSNIAVVGSGLFMGFLGTTISGFIMQLIPNFHNILKWNPLNMIYIISQLNNSKFKYISGLSSIDLIIGNITYSLLFLYFGYLLFKKRRI